MPAPSSKDLILQSAPPRRAGWIERCLQSVAHWAERSGLERRLIGDELFDPVPASWRAAAGPEKLPLTDYARLLWIERLLGEGYERVIWLDADVLMLDMNFVPPPGDFFCREMWVYRRPDGRDGALDSINNCAMGFVSGSALLDWYRTACAEAPSEKPLSRLALGPDMLKRRHRASPLPWTEAIPTLSPLMIRGILRGDKELLETFLWEWKAPMAAAHLCSSLREPPDGAEPAQRSVMDAAIDRLQAGILSS